MRAKIVILLIILVTFFSSDTFSKNEVKITEYKIKKDLYGCRVLINKQHFNLFYEGAEKYNKLFSNSPRYMYDKLLVNTNDSITLHFEVLGTMNGREMIINFVKNVNYFKIAEIIFINYNFESIGDEYIVYNPPNSTRNLNINKIPKTFLKYHYCKIFNEFIKDDSFEIYFNVNSKKSNIVFYNTTKQITYIFTIPFKIEDFVCDSSFYVTFNTNFGSAMMELNISNDKNVFVSAFSTYLNKIETKYVVFKKQNIVICISKHNEFEIKTNIQNNVLLPTRYLQ